MTELRVKSSLKGSYVKRKLEINCGWMMQMEQSVEQYSFVLYCVLADIVLHCMKTCFILSLCKQFISSNK